MPRYSILRRVGDISPEELDAAAMRAIWCLADYPDMQWIRSYWDRGAGEVLCIYDAPNEDELRAHAESARLPCDEVAEVEEFGPEIYLNA